MRQKRIWIPILIGLIIIAGVIGSWIYKQSSKEPEVYKIGAILPLTGSAARLGELKKNGMLLAEEEINASGGIRGKKIKLVIEDSKNDPKQGIAALNKLINVDKVPVVISAMSSVSLALAPIVDRRNIVLFADVGHPEVTKVSKWIFRNFPTTKTEARVMAELIRKKQFTKIAILTINDEWGRSLQNELVKSLSSLNVTISFIDFFEKDGKDFRLLLTKLTSTNPEAVYLGGYGKALGIIVKQLREINYKGQILAGMGLPIEDALSIAGNAAEGAIATSPEFDPYTSSQNFVDKYKERFNEIPNFDAAIEYDSVQMIAEAIRVNGYSAEGIRNGLLKMKKFKGVSGFLEIPPSRDITSPLVLKIIKNGKPIPYKLE